MHIGINNWDAKTYTSELEKYKGTVWKQEERNRHRE